MFLVRSIVPFHRILCIFLNILYCAELDCNDYNIIELV
nr:MAG TPA: hypothetical protein [Caudoviricetes sp.]